MTSLTRKSVRGESPGCIRAKNITGMSLSFHDQMLIWLTVRGSLGRARSTRSRTSALARFMSVVAWKCTLAMTESWRAEESMSWMPWIVRSSSSSTRATCSSFSGALAPMFCT